MKNVFVAALAAAGLIATMSASSAMTVAPNSTGGDSLVQTIAGGCGPGFHRTPYGRCVPFRRGYAPAPYYRPAPNYVPRRGCPRGMHPGNSGRCVPNY